MDLKVTGVTLEEHAGVKRVRVVCDCRYRLTYRLHGGRAVIVHEIGDTPLRKVAEMSWTVRIAMWLMAQKQFRNPAKPCPTVRTMKGARTSSHRRPWFPADVWIDAVHHARQNPDPA